MNKKKNNINKKSFIMKWFFPPTFSIFFYPVFIFMWFSVVHKIDRNLDNFINYAINFLAIYSIIYLGVDTKDGRFTTFMNYVESRSKWKARFIIALIFIVWFMLIAFAHKHFPILT